MKADDLNKWQASSHPELTQKNAGQLFPAEHAQRYKILHDQLTFRLIQVHGTIHTLEELEPFPFGYIYGPPGNMEFWHLVVENFLDTAIIMLHALTSDSGQDTHTILSFKNEIDQWPWLDNNMHSLFRRTLRERQFAPEIRRLADQIRDIRHKSVAHSLVHKSSGLPKEHPGVDLPDLRRLFDAAHSLFGTLCFGGAIVTLSGDQIPGMAGGKPSQTCLGTVLDAVLRESYFVNRPELEHQSWSCLRKHIDKDQLRVMNECRKRIGLSEA